MHKAILVLCLLVFAASNLLSQVPDKMVSVAVDSGYVSVEGEKLYYEMAGKGNDVVLLHDGLIHREVWDGQFLELAKNFRVMRYAQHGGFPGRSRR